LSVHRVPGIGARTRTATGRHETEADRIRLFDGWWGRSVASAISLVRRWGLLWRVNFSVTGAFGSQPVTIPFLFGNGCQQLQVGERWMLRALQRVLRVRSGAVLDIGMNLGQTLLKIKLIDRDREYYGFEPNPQAFHYATQLVERNAFRACTLIPVGLSDRMELVPLLSRGDVDPSASLVAGFRAPSRYKRAQWVPIFRGDDVVRWNSIERLAVVKVDVEGGELEVLEGLAMSLAASRPYVFCEVLPVFDPESDTGRFRLARQIKLKKLLDRWGYRVFRILRNETVSEIEDFGVHSDMALSNYVFIPATEIARVPALFPHLS
jgi:FkbM family methyltransferase